jgi:hypothetical protein
LPIDYCALRGLALYAISTRTAALRAWPADDSIVRLIDALDDEVLWGLLAYTTNSGKRFEQKRVSFLAHFPNHQLGRAQR